MPQGLKSGCAERSHVLTAHLEAVAEGGDNLLICSNLGQPTATSIGSLVSSGFEVDALKIGPYRLDRRQSMHGRL
jgi:hypothetical protein